MLYRCYIDVIYMVKTKFVSPVIGLRGKLTSGSDYHFRINKQTGHSFMVVVENPNTRPPSVAQTQHRMDFGQKSRLVKQWFDDNKPNEDQPKGTEEYQRMKKAYNRQYQIGSMFGFVFKKLFKA